MIRIQVDSSEREELYLQCEVCVDILICGKALKSSWNSFRRYMVMIAHRGQRIGWLDWEPSSYVRTPPEAGLIGVFLDLVMRNVADAEGLGAWESERKWEGRWDWGWLTKGYNLAATIAVSSKQIPAVWFTSNTQG